MIDSIRILLLLVLLAFVAVVQWKSLASYSLMLLLMLMLSHSFIWLGVIRVHLMGASAGPPIIAIVGHGDNILIIVSIMVSTIAVGKPILIVCPVHCFRSISSFSLGHNLWVIVLFIPSSVAFIIAAVTLGER